VQRDNGTFVFRSPIQERPGTFRAHETPSNIALPQPTLELRAIFKAVVADLLTSCFSIKALYKKRSQTCYLSFRNVPIRSSLP
jgi:hypothetical protein